MKVTEVSNKGLKREYKVVVAADEIERDVVRRLQDVGKRVKLPGFRPGKVPHDVLKQKYGKSVMGEVLEQVTNRTTREALEKQGVKPAMPPKVAILKFDEGKDLEYSINLEVLPELPAIAYEKISLEKLVCEATDAQLSEALERIAGASVQYNAPATARAAKKDDALIIDFKGSVDGEFFQGGTAEGFRVVLGSNQLIPGFEDQLIGSKIGDAVTVKVTFPKDYGNKELAGKAAEFAVDVKEILAPSTPDVDDALAKSKGFESLDEMKVRLRDRLNEENAEFAREKLKKALFDVLDGDYDFEVPQTMYDLEFESIWKSLQDAKRQGDASLQKPDDELRKEYEGICRRRVKLGVLLSEIGKKNAIEVTQRDLRDEVSRRAMQYPGAEKSVVEFYQKNPQALENIQGAVFEEKVVDFILGKVNLKEKKVTQEQLTAEAEEASGAPKKKAAAKKEKSSDEEEESTSDKKKKK